MLVAVIQIQFRSVLKLYDIKCVKSENLRHISIERSEESAALIQAHVTWGKTKK